MKRTNEKVGNSPRALESVRNIFNKMKILELKSIIIESKNSINIKRERMKIAQLSRDKRMENTCF